jgi:hypothetical protein
MLGMGRVSRAAFSLTVENRQHVGHFRCPPHVALKNLVVNRGRSPPSTRRLLTRGARTSQVPLPVTSFCGAPCRCEPTCARPRSSCASRCRLTYSSTSASNASWSIFSAPRCRSSSSLVRSSSFSFVGFSANAQWVASPSPPAANRACVGTHTKEPPPSSSTRSTTFRYISSFLWPCSVACLCSSVALLWPSVALCVLLWLVVSWRHVARQAITLRKV